MSVKNALRILIGRFGVVWGIMLFIAIFALIIISLSMVFVLPVVSILKEAGVFEQISILYETFLSGNFSLNEMSNKMSEAKDMLTQVYSGNFDIKVNLILLIVLVFIIVNKFLLGYYELPALEVLHDKMSYNAKTSFLGRFISNFKKSTRFVLVKMLYTILADVIIVGVMFGLFHLWGINALLTLFLPFIMMLVFIPLQALRYALIAGWAPAVVVDKKGIFAGFKASTSNFVKHFGRTFGGFIIAWTLIIVINLLFALLTFGAALVLTIPASMAFVSTLNMTIYYANTNRRYYITDENIQRILPENLGQSDAVNKD